MTTKEKIKRIVGNYKIQFPSEYKAVVKQIKKKREDEKNFSKVSGGEGLIERALYDIPETLYLLFKAVLTNEEYLWLFSPTSKKGGYWFCKEFPEFKVSERKNTSIIK